MMRERYYSSSGTETSSGVQPSSGVETPFDAADRNGSSFVAAEFSSLASWVSRSPLSLPLRCNASSASNSAMRHESVFQFTNHRQCRAKWCRVA